nr:right-handed parallel beta-helix repeat-containing protein [Streptomyces sp. QL37]PPQ59376.1 pectate lyase [Streptomyces sp. QL37]
MTGADVYLAPDGSDDGDGSRERPFATLGKAASVVRPGQTIAMRGGTYRPAEGAAADPLTDFAERTVTGVVKPPRSIPSAPLSKARQPRTVFPAPEPNLTARPTPSASPTVAAARRTGAAIGVTGADVYLAPDGSDDGDGSRERPFATLGKAASVVRPGQTIAMRGGTYRPAEGAALITDGTAGRRITLSNYRGERPVIDASGLPGGTWAVTQEADNWTVQGLEIRGSASHAYVCRSCRNTVFRGLSLHDNAESGLTLRDAGTENNTVLDSDFYANGPGEAGGVGLAVKFGSGAGNTVRGCRAFDNGADGIDLGGFTTPVTVRSTWSYRNGNGFTLGGGHTSASVAHVLTDDAAWDNAGLGFNDEGNPGAIRLTRNTSYRNGTGFYLATAAAVLTSNAAVDSGDGPDTVLAESSRSEGNTWDGGNGASPVFTTTDPSTAEARRAADATLPRTSFLAPSGSAPGARMAPVGETS